MYVTYSEFISSMPPLWEVPVPESLLPPPEARRGEVGLLVETEARGTGLVSPMLLRLPPDDTVMVTGEEEGDDAVLTMLLK